MAPRFEAWDTGLWEPIAKMRDWALSSARTFVRPSPTQSFDVRFGPSFGLAAGPVNHYAGAEIPQVAEEKMYK